MLCWKIRKPGGAQCSRRATYKSSMVPVVFLIFFRTHVCCIEYTSISIYECLCLNVFPVTYQTSRKIGLLTKWHDGLKQRPGTGKLCVNESDVFLSFFLFCFSSRYDICEWYERILAGFFFHLCSVSLRCI